MKTKLFVLGLALLTGFSDLSAQKRVSQETMAEIYEQVKTPYKYGMVLAPGTNNYKMDCPTVFRKGDKWYMTYVVYNGRTGQDGRGYETWIAESENLLEWDVKGKVLEFRDGMWDCNQRGGFPALPDMEWGGSYELQAYKGKNWMTYIGGDKPGYETSPLHIGLAWTKAGDLTEAKEWSALDKPLMSSQDKDAQWFENLTEYKSTIYWDKEESLGAPFVMFYNAGGRHPETNLKGERIGIALSKNMKRWKRFQGNPVFSHESQGTITGDAHIQKIGDVYVMFYFSAFEPSRKYKAFNTFACSYDLVHWDDWQGEDLITPSKSYDDLFAHKSYVISHEGVVYHFYCAVNRYDQRGIAVATSKPMGRSAVKFPQPEVKGRRNIVELNQDWETSLDGKNWQKVNIPHNWDDYYGYRQLTHGNLHDVATYKKKFIAPEKVEDKRFFIRFEGVGTYAAVTLNGKNMGRYPSGRTTFTLDVTDELIAGKENVLEVKAEHPEMIMDMPWVCGGCSSEWGFSEGSQPLGIFRPVVLEVVDQVRIEPFGVHVWNDDRASLVSINTEVKNYSDKSQTVEVVNKLNDSDGRAVFRLAGFVTLAPGETKIISQSSPVSNPELWSVENPYLYSLASMIKRDGKTTDEISTPFGIRTISWPVKRNDNDGRFFLNNEPVFMNGVCEYEHQFGQSHAFSREQVAARVKQMKNAGFNAFRDAHQPHHLDYQKYWDESGILFWTQFSAHIWYDTPEFRENFKKLLRQWVKERRNSPSVVIWGLQNESTLPRDFAQECSDIIRGMDPTAHNMRIITTCNGGEGTDWNVIQNWSGTYGGDIFRYGKELSQKNQLLNGEYGAWRSIDLHTEPGDFQQNGVWSEERMCLLMETKIREAERMKDSVCGQFQWIYSSHDNPGRRQPDEAFRTIDKVGPFNYKGLVTPWEEPLDVYYMYKANYVPAKADPFVYLVSHTWPDRFKARRRATVEVYSNCDSVLLYNDMNGEQYLGRKKNNGIGTHFTWENRDIRYNVLRAVGYFEGKPVAQDLIVLNNLEKAPGFDQLYQGASDMLKGAPDYNYLYRLNCGGNAYTDEFGQQWLKDDVAFSRSWASDFEGLSPYQASQRVSNDPVQGVKDWSLFQHFRFGRHKLNYTFALPDGRYRVELYFNEPWHGTGGSYRTDCEGLRIFDVAVNGQTVADDLDIWAEAGHDVALKKVVEVDIRGGELKISFPEVKAGQAILSAVAIATQDPQLKVDMPAQTDWDWNKDASAGMEKTPKELLPEDKNARMNVSYQAEDAVMKGGFKKIQHKKQTGVLFTKNSKSSIEWNISTGLAQVYALRFKYMNQSKKPVNVKLKFVDSKGIVLKEDMLTFQDTPDKWRLVSTTTGSYINAGNYKVILSGENLRGLSFDALDVQ